VVGDSGRDLAVGREAGIPLKNTIGIYRGITPMENLLNMHPKPVIIRDLKELLKII